MGAHRLRRAAGTAMALTLSASLLSGCSFVAGFFGIQFETFYSPEQREVFRTSVELGTKSLTNGVVVFSPQELYELEESGIAICESLRSSSRQEVKQRIIDEIISDAPLASESNAGRLAEVLIQASTAQGSLCSELR